MAGPSETIIVEGETTFALPGASVSVLFLIRNNTTPLLGYSLDIGIVPDPGAVGTVTPEVDLTNFYEVQNLITAGGAELHPVFSRIIDMGDGTVFINALTEDNSTVLAIDDVNDVLAQVFFHVSTDASDTFSIQLGPASALSD